MSVAESIYNSLKDAGIEVVIDDRDERPGVKFKDADLIGFPFRITVGKSIQNGNVEFVIRETGTKEEMTPEKAVETTVKLVRDALSV